MGLEVSYDLPTVDLKKEDIEWLWQSIYDLFMTDSNNPRFSLLNSIEVTLPGGTKVEEKDLQGLRQSGFMREMAKEIRVYFSSNFDFHGAIERRTLSLWVNYGTHLKLNGSREWTERAHGLLGDWLKRRSSKNKWPRVITFGLMWFLGVAIIIAVGIHSSISSNVFVIAGLVWGWVSLWPVWSVASRMYPVPSIMIEREIGWPWYVRWAHRILVTVGLSILAAIIYSLLVAR